MATQPTLVDQLSIPDEPTLVDQLSVPAEEATPPSTPAVPTAGGPTLVDQLSVPAEPTLVDQLSMPAEAPSFAEQAGYQLKKALLPSSVSTEEAKKEGAESKKAGAESQVGAALLGTGADILSTLAVGALGAKGATALAAAAAPLAPILATPAGILVAGIVGSSIYGIYKALEQERLNAAEAGQKYNPLRATAGAVMELNPLLKFAKYSKGAQAGVQAGASLVSSYESEAPWWMAVPVAALGGGLVYKAGGVKLPASVQEEAANAAHVGALTSAPLAGAGELTPQAAEGAFKFAAKHQGVDAMEKKLVEKAPRIAADKKLFFGVADDIQGEARTEAIMTQYAPFWSYKDWTKADSAVKGVLRESLDESENALLAPGSPLYERVKAKLPQASDEEVADRVLYSLGRDRAHKIMETVLQTGVPDRAKKTARSKFVDIMYRKDSLEQDRALRVFYEAEASQDVARETIPLQASVSTAKSASKILRNFKSASSVCREIDRGGVNFETSVSHRNLMQGENLVTNADTALAGNVMTAQEKAKKLLPGVSDKDMSTWLQNPALAPESQRGAVLLVREDIDKITDSLLDLERSRGVHKERIEFYVPHVRAALAARVANTIKAGEEMGIVSVNKSQAGKGYDLLGSWDSLQPVLTAGIAKDADKEAKAAAQTARMWIRSLEGMSGFKVTDQDSLTKALQAMQDSDSLIKQSIKHEATSGFKRKDAIPEWELETNVFRALMLSGHDVHRAHYMDKHIQELSMKSAALRTAGQTADADYVDGLVATAAGLHPRAMRGAGVGKALQSAELQDQIHRLVAAGQGDEVGRSGAAIGVSAMDTLAGLVYPNLLATPKGMIRNTMGGTYQVASELGPPQYAAGVMFKAALRTVADLKAGRLKSTLASEGLTSEHVGREVAAVKTAVGLPKTTTEKAREALDKWYTRPMMSMFTVSENLNRGLTMHTADVVVEDLLKDPTKFAKQTGVLSRMGEGDKSAMARLLRQGDREGATKMLRSYLQGRTQFFYSEMDRSQFMRNMGPALSVFTTWPTNIASEVVENFQTGRNGRTLLRLLAPYAVIASTANYMDIDEDYPEIKALLGNVEGVTPASAVFDVLSFTTGPVIGMGVSATKMSKAALEGDFEAVGKELHKVSKVALPGYNLLTGTINKDLGTLIKGSPFIEND